MGSAPSTENKEENTVTKEENKNEVIYQQEGMKVINIHGETVMISLAATTIMIFFLLALYKFMERRSCWKKRRTPEPVCPECQTSNIPMTSMKNLQVAAPTVTSLRTVMMTTQGLPEKWPSSWFPSNWPPLRTPSLPPKYSREYRKEREEGRSMRKQEESAPPVEKEQERDNGEPVGRNWDGAYVRKDSE